MKANAGCDIFSWRHNILNLCIELLPSEEQPWKHILVPVPNEHQAVCNPINDMCLASDSRRFQSKNNKQEPSLGQILSTVSMKLQIPQKLKMKSHKDFTIPTIQVSKNRKFKGWKQTTHLPTLRLKKKRTWKKKWGWVYRATVACCSFSGFPPCLNNHVFLEFSSSPNSSLQKGLSLTTSFPFTFNFFLSIACSSLCIQLLSG